MPAACLTRDMPVAEAVRQLLLDQLQEISQKGEMVLDEDEKNSVNAVHDLRVACRRSLAILQSFTPWLDSGWIKKYSKIYHKILQPMGKIRDLDVLSAWATSLPVQVEPDPRITGFIESLAQDRRHARMDLPALLNGKKFRKTLARQNAELNLPDATIRMSLPAISPKGVVRLYRLKDCLPVLLYSAAARVTVYHAAIPDPASLPENMRQNEDFFHDLKQVSTDTLHRLRVAAKNFRYLVEAVQPVLGKANASQLIKEFKVFQDMLGNWHDSIIACQHLDRYLLHLTPTEAAPAGQKPAFQLESQRTADEFKNIFIKKWPAMTPAWFHERISACLD